MGTLGDEQIPFAIKLRWLLHFCTKEETPSAFTTYLSVMKFLNATNCSAMLKNLHFHGIYINQ